jgi:hypothetical protein
VYQAEQARVRERLESAVELAEQAFATELQRLTAHLAERLTGLHDGQPKVFRDSAVENLREIGKLQITRASHVEPDAEACGTADLCSVGELSRLPDGANTALFRVAPSHPCPPTDGCERIRPAERSRRPRGGAML